MKDTTEKAHGLTLVTQDGAKTETSAKWERRFANMPIMPNLRDAERRFKTAHEIGQDILAKIKANYPTAEAPSVFLGLAEATIATLKEWLGEIPANEFLESMDGDTAWLAFTASERQHSKAKGR